MALARKAFVHSGDWLAWVLGALAVLSLGGFGVYYYYDRYVHPDESLLDRQARHVEELVQKNPQNPDLRVGAGNYYLDAGSIDQAIQQGEEALKIEPNHQGALILLGRAYEKKGAINTAIGYLTRVVELNKDNPMAKIDQRLEAVFYTLGILYSRENEYPQAVAALKNALAIDRTDSDAHYTLGIVYQKQNDHANAVSEFQEALRFVPNFAEAYQGLETSYAALGNAPGAAYAHAMVAFSQGQYSDAAAKLEAVVKQSPDLVPAYLGLGLAYEKLGKRDQALTALQRYVNAKPNDIAAQQAIGRLSQEVKP